MEAGPIPNELKGPPRKLSVEHGPIEGDPGDVTRVTSMKVGRIVVAEEHQDGYSVEGTDSRHGFESMSRA